MTLSDAPDVFAYAKDPDVLRYTTGTTPRHLEETREFLEGAAAVPNGRMWAIQLRGQPTVIGAVEFSLLSPDVGSVHYVLGKPYWGRGLMTEAVDAVCNWAFDTLPAMLEIKIVDFKGMDVEPPQVCLPAEYGLFGCCSSANLADCASVAQRFAAPSDVAAALRQWSPGFVGQLLGRGVLAKKALKTIGNDYYSGHWQTLCRAVLVTTSRGHYLGLGLSG
jgi:hypothetical protein